MELHDTLITDWFSGVFVWSLDESLQIHLGRDILTGEPMVELRAKGGGSPNALTQCRVTEEMLRDPNFEIVALSYDEEAIAAAQVKLVLAEMLGKLATNETTLEELKEFSKRLRDIDIPH